METPFDQRSMDKLPAIYRSHSYSKMPGIARYSKYLKKFSSEGSLSNKTTKRFNVHLLEWRQRMVENKMGAELTQKVDAKQKSGSILDHQFSLSVIDKSRSFNSSGYSSLYIRRSSSAPVKKLSQPVGNNAVMIKTEGKGTTNQLESTHAHTEDCTDQQQDNLIDGVQACSNTKLVAGFVGMEIYSKTSDASTLLHSQSSPVTYAEARQSSPVTYAEASKFSLLSLSQPDLSESCEQSSNTSLNSDSLLGSMGSDFNLTSSSLATITPLTNVSSWSDLELATQQHEIGRVDEDDVNCGSTNHENGMKQNLVNNVGKDNGIKECKDEHNSSKTTLSGHTAHLQCSLSCPEIYNKYGEIQVGSLQKLDEGNPKTFSLIKRSQSLDALMQNASCINGGDLTVPIALHTVIPESSRTRRKSLTRMRAGLRKMAKNIKKKIGSLLKTMCCIQGFD